jgi:hypothetical protein
MDWNLIRLWRVGFGIACLFGCDLTSCMLSSVIALSAVRPETGVTTPIPGLFPSFPNPNCHGGLVSY